MDSKYTLRELCDKQKAFCEETGAQSCCFYNRTDNAIFFMVDICQKAKKPNEYTAGTFNYNVTGNTFDEIFTLARAKWEEEWPKAREELTNEMAYSIIRLANENGEVTHAALRQEGYTQKHIDMVGFLAQSKAIELASRYPYRIVDDLNKDNGAPIEQPSYIPPAPITRSNIDDEIPF